MNPLPHFGHSETLSDSPRDPRDVARQGLPAGDEAGTGPVPPKRLLHVLCIDDDEMVLESMKDFIAYFGHRVGVASGGTRGIEVFRTAILKSEPYDVVITDMNMPGLNGYAVAQIIKAESPDIPVILITGAGDTTMDSGASSASVDAVVNKPVHMQELNDLLLRVVSPA